MHANTETPMNILLQRHIGLGGRTSRPQLVLLLLGVIGVMGIGISLIDAPQRSDHAHTFAPSR